MALFGKVFAKKEALGSFSIDHYDGGDIVFVESLGSSALVRVAYYLYFDQLVYNSGPHWGPKLWSRIHTIASETIQKAEGDQGPPEGFTCPSRTKSRVVGTPSGTRVLRTEVKLCKKGDSPFVESEFTPKTCPSIEYEVRKGCEALFVHLYDTGDNGTKFALPLSLMAECTWYEENGFPGPTQICKAASAAIQTEFWIAEQMS